MLLEVLGKLVQTELFWHPVAKVVTTGISAKEGYDKRRQQEIDEISAALRAMGGLVGFDTTHEVVEALELPGRSSIIWTDAYDALSSSAVFEDEEGRIAPSAKQLPKADGWMSVDYQDDVWMVVESRVAATNVATLRIGYRNTEDDWIVSSAMLSRHEMGDSYPCRISYSGRLWRPKQRSLVSMVFGSSEQRLVEGLETIFAENVAFFSSIFDSTEMSNDQLTAQLAQLIQMRQAGDLTEDEFVAAKAKLLGR